MKFKILIKKILVCILSFMVALAVFTPATFASSEDYTQQLYVSVQRGDLEKVKQLVADGADVNCKSYSIMPLHLAAYWGHLEVVKWLIIEGNADINCTDENSMTPLLWATYNGHLDVIKWLIKEGANVNCRDERGQTPLHWAVIENRTDIGEILIQHGANVNIKDNESKTALMLAKEKCRYDLVQILIDANNENPDVKEPNHCIVM